MNHLSKSGKHVNFDNIEITPQSMQEEDFLKAYPMGEWEHYDEYGIEMFLADVVENMEKSEDTDAELEKAKKDISKLQRKVITTKTGHQKVVYVKPTKVEGGHSHPSDKHAEAVSVYHKKRSYMSKENAKNHVERHHGKNMADYAHGHHAGNKKTADKGAPKGHIVDGKDETGLVKLGWGIVHIKRMSDSTKDKFKKESVKSPEGLTEARKMIDDSNKGESLKDEKKWQGLFDKHDKKKKKEKKKAEDDTENNDDETDEYKAEFDELVKGLMEEHDYDIERATAIATASMKKGRKDGNELHKAFDSLKNGSVVDIVDIIIGRHDEISKGILDGYGESSIKKKGSEIKEKITGYITKKEGEVKTYKSELDELLKGVDTKPTEDCEYHKDTVDDVGYKMFSDSLVYDGHGDTTSKEDAAAKAVVSPDERSKMRKYNDKLYDYTSCMSSVAKANTVSRNVKDDEEYELSVSELTKLGF